MATLAELLVKVGVDADGVDKKMLAAGAAAGTALVAGVVGAMNVEAANDKLAAQLGANAGEAERLGDIAGDLYSGAWGDSLEHVNQALRGVVQNVGGMADASDEELQSVTASVIDLGTAFEQDVGEVSRSVGKLIKAGLADDAGDALDILTRGFQTGADEAGDLLDTVNEYSTLFREVGLSGEQAMGLISQGLDAGARDADKVADAIKEFSIRAKDGSDLTAEGFAAVGLNAADMADAIAEGGPRATDALDQTLDALRAMEDPVARDAAAVALFGTQAEDLGDALFALDPSGATAALGQVEGAAQRMGDTLNDNAKTNITSFIRQAKMAFIDILGGQILPIVSMVAAFLATNFGPALATVASIIQNQVIPAVTAMIGFIRDNSTVFTVVAAIIAAVFIPHLVALGVAATVARIKVVAAWVATQAAAIKAAVVHSAQIVRMVAMWVVLGTQSLIHAARVAAAWLIAMGPIGLVIAAVVALVAVVVANWDKIWSVIKAGWQAVTNFTRTVWNGVLAFLARVWLTIVTGVSVGIRNIVRFFAGLPNKVISALGNLRSRALTFFVNVLGGAVDGVKRGIEFLEDWIRYIPRAIVFWFGNAGSILWKAGWNLIRGLIDGIGANLGNLKGYLGDIGGWITSWKGPEDHDRRLLIPAGQALMDGLMVGIGDQLPSLRRQLGDVSGQVESDINAMIAPHVAVPDGQSREIVIRGDGSERANFLLEELRAAIQRQGGGDVQLVLGGRR